VSSTCITKQEFQLSESWKVFSFWGLCSTPGHRWGGLQTPCAASLFFTSWLRACFYTSQVWYYMQRKLCDMLMLTYLSCRHFIRHNDRPESSTVCKSQYETQHAGEARSEARRAKVGGQRTAYPQGKGSGEHRKFPSWGPGPGRQTCIVDTEDDLDLLGQHSSNFKFKRRFALLLAHSIS